MLIWCECHKQLKAERGALESRMSGVTTQFQARVGLIASSSFVHAVTASWRGSVSLRVHSYHMRRWQWGIFSLLAGRGFQNDDCWQGLCISASHSTSWTTLAKPSRTSSLKGRRQQRKLYVAFCTQPPHQLMLVSVNKYILSWISNLREIVSPMISCLVIG